MTPFMVAWFLLLLWAAPLGAAEQPRLVFGPEEFVNSTGGTATFDRSFTVPASATTPFTLCLLNGEPEEQERRSERCPVLELRRQDMDDEDERDEEHKRHGKKEKPKDPETVTGGRVLVDGREVVSTRDLSKHDEVIEKSLRLTAGPHRLIVELHGPPGSHLTLAIVGVIRLGKLAQARAGHTATLLSDGTMLLTGGRDKEHEILTSAEVFDPSTLRSARLPAELTSTRAEHSATLVPTGEVLLAAGRDVHGVLFSAELFQRDGTFHALPATVQVSRAGHTATLLPDGRVVILGGLDVSRQPLDQGETFDLPSGALYDPRTGTFTLLPQALTVPRHHHSATLLPNGLVLVVGGRHEDEVLASAELFDPSKGESTLLDAHLRTARAQHTASLLNDGRVLVAGGRGKKDALDSVEVFDPVSQTFKKLRPKLREERFSHTATGLPTGEILLAGGREDEDKDPTKDTELYLQPGRDTAPPSVLTITPASAAAEVSLTPLVAIQFSEPINVTTLTDSTLTLTGHSGIVPGLVSPGEEGLLAFLVPGGPLKPGTAYTLTLNGLKDRAGNPMAPVTSSFTTVQATPAGPSISSFSPMNGPVGTAVTITGQNFDPVATNNQVKFNGKPAIITSAATTTLSTTVPQGATTGPITVTTAQVTTSSTQDFTVTLSQNFNLNAAPAQTTVVQGGQGSYVLNVTAVGSFTGLVTLGVTGLPVGVTATFSSPTLTAGQTSYLTLNAASAVPAGLVAFNLTGTTQLEIGPSTQSIPLTLNVLFSGGQTAVAGQILSTAGGTPIPNVQVTLIGSTQTRTDAAGNFLLQNVSSGVQRLMVDANAAVAGLPIYHIDITLTAGITNVLPPIYLTPPPPADRFTPISNAMADQIITDTRFPGVEITLPAGVTITGWDGALKTKIAIERLTPDRLPVPPPPGPTRSLYQLFFGTPMGGVPSARLPVTGPNDIGLDPGQKAELWYYDASPLGEPGAWRLAGLATVSADGTKIVSDPGVGIQRFCGVCGLFCFIDVQGAQPNTNPQGDEDGEPVNLATGLFTVSKTDLVLPGRFPISLSRTYNPLDPFNNIAGFRLSLGLGWSLSLDAALLPIPTISPNLIRLILPGNSRFDLTKQSDGTFRNATHPLLRGAVLTLLPNGDYQLRFKDGATWQFRLALIPSTRGTAIGFLVEMADRNNNRVTIERGGVLGISIRRIVDEAGRSYEVTTDSEFGRIRQIRDPLGRTVQYDYDILSRLVSVTDPDGGVTQYAYDSAGRITAITDPKAIVFITNEYGPSSGRILRQVQADGGIWLFRYALQGATVTGPGCPGPTCPTEESVERVAQGYAFAGGTVVSTTVVDPRGQASTYRFNPAGFTSERIDTVGQRIASTRDGANLLTATTDSLGRQTRFAFDAAGNVTTITDAAGHQTRFAYEPTFSRLTQLTDALNQVTSFAYDTKGNLLSTADPLGHTTSVTYNSFGQPTNTTDSLGHTTTFDYDALGNLIASTDPLGKITRREYDVVGRLISLTDPRGFTTQFTYDTLNRVTAITDALSGVTTFTYDPNGNLLTVTDAEGHTTTYTYDSMDRLVSRKDGLGREERYEYDPAGNLIRFTDRKNQVTTFTYDALNRRTRADYADSSFTTFIYDAAGRLIAAEDSLVGRIDFLYDVLDRLIKEVSAQGVVEYTYDALGLRTQMTANGQIPVGYQYDAATRLTQVAQAGLVVGLGYDAAGRRTSLTYPNGTSTSYGYDNASRLTNITHNGPAGLIESLSYTYDAAGNRISLTRTNGTATLLPAAVQAAYDAANEQIQFNSASPNQTFDANGNLTFDGTNTYTWDARNRLIAITGPGLSASFSYDALGRRVSKTINGINTQYLYDGQDIVQEIGGGAVGASYVRSLNIDEPFIRQVGSNEFYHTDALGSTLALTSDPGQIATTYTYEAFGKTITAGMSSNPFQYTGRENDGIGIHYYRARYYGPALHRFISEDPIRLAGGDINLYSYVLNNPLNLADPWGLTTLVFDSSDDGLYVYPGDTNTHGPPQAFPAANYTTNPAGDPNKIDSNAPAPRGTFPVQPPINTAGKPEYGPYFFPIGAVGPNGERLDIARKRGIGIHGGRGLPEARTRGCIRVEDRTARELARINRGDPITTITIR